MLKVAEAMFSSPVKLSETQLAKLAGVSRRHLWEIKGISEFNEWLFQEYRRRKGAQFVSMHQYGINRAMAGNDTIFKTIYPIMANSLGEGSAEQAPVSVNIFAEHVLAASHVLNKPPPTQEEIERDYREAKRGTSD